MQEVERDYGIPVISIASLDDLLTFLADRPEMVENKKSVEAYRTQYGIKTS